ncbi:hypothetical protein DPMN_194326 [Dreissena polymorpha]|uniref:Uncharacterized protein n=1 Tax=Dreissena polymorpha TaxID=45954 RepID=A0A9D3Y5T1_DREPO|nr:hypothetical protein DPMN_194326 [Dreissena polymorpha]
MGNYWLHITYGEKEQRDETHRMKRQAVKEQLVNRGYDGAFVETEWIKGRQ